MAKCISIPSFGLIDIVFEVLTGQLATLVGLSGCGTTTVAIIVSRIHDVDSGSVTIDGVDLRDVTLASLGTVIGMVTQEGIENVARAAAIHDRIVELPEEYGTVDGERDYKLSGGET